MPRALVVALLIEEILEMEEEEEIAKSGKKKRIWVQDWRKKRPKRSHTNLLKELEISCPKDYKKFLRMDVAVYNDLLALITPLIEKQDTIMRDAISPKCTSFRNAKIFGHWRVLRNFKISDTHCYPNFEQNNNRNM